MKILKKELVLYIFIFRWRSGGDGWSQANKRTFFVPRHIPGTSGLLSNTPSAPTRSPENETRVFCSISFSCLTCCSAHPASYKMPVPVNEKQ